MNNKAKPAILFVDDETIVLETLKEQVRRFFGDKYIYEIAENAEDAWEIIEYLHKESTPVCLILSDWLMPGIYGDEFLISVHKKYPDIIKILLTGYTHETIIENTQKGAFLYSCLHKPWQESELINTIKSGIKKYYAACNNLC